MVTPRSTSTWPSSGCSWPVIIRNSVVLPDPLGPTGPTFSPFWIAADASMKRIWWPFCLLTLSRRIMCTRDLEKLRCTYAICRAHGRVLAARDYWRASTELLSFPKETSPGEKIMRAAHRALAFASFCALVVPLAAHAAAPLPRAKPEEVGMSSERLALIRKVILSEVARDQLPGGVLAIARRGKLVHFEAYGYLDKAAGTPMRTDAIFNIASMTKPMV